MVRLLARAYEDLLGLDAHHGRTGGAEPFPSDVVIDKLRLLEEFPLAGPLHHDRYLADRGYRKLLADKWLAIYRVEGNDVLVARVFHQRADYLKGLKGAFGE
ncbi:type II toxin-antitoxin system RelE/ParE family toxin [Paratractidigestivibacter sp.]|uniref:type II toxin-antitoxin system RelE/ParE family toxin n=1 Tax=Paratractidigestivibacter sp. TaxID=2847316 RepID=UPI002ABDAEC4|nr:type II toxin-antitoxin system RelE/ParE family toxin [Paratractidigestivibacter sp.]